MLTRVLLATASAGSVLVVAACAAPAPTDNPGAAIVVGQVTQGAASGGYHGIVLDQPYAEPTATFTDMAGQPFSFAADAKAAVVLVFFGYTNCPDVCATVLADVAAALRPLDPGTRHRIELVFITTDPGRDTGPVMRDYLGRFDPTFIGVSAPIAQTAAVAADLGVALTGRDGSGTTYTVGHGAQVLGFGANHLADVIWLPGTPVGDLRADVVRLASQP